MKLWNVALPIFKYFPGNSSTCNSESLSFDIKNWPILNIVIAYYGSLLYNVVLFWRLVSGCAILIFCNAVFKLVIMNKHFEIHLTLRKERSDLASKKTEVNFVRERECVCSKHVMSLYVTLIKTQLIMKLINNNTLISTIKNSLILK